MPDRGLADGNPARPEAAVLVPAEEWRRLQASARRSLKELLLSGDARGGFRVSAEDRPTTQPCGAAVAAMYLLDTNVASERRRPKPRGVLLQWIDGVADADLHISAVTVGEIQAGIELIREQDEPKADELEQWPVQVSASFNVVTMDASAFASGRACCTALPTRRCDQAGLRMAVRVARTRLTDAIDSSVQGATVDVIHVRPAGAVAGLSATIDRKAVPLKGLDRCTKLTSG